MERIKGTFAQFRAGARDLGTVTPNGRMFAIVLIDPDAVYLAPIGTPIKFLDGEPGPLWTLMADVSEPVPS